MNSEELHPAIAQRIAALSPQQRKLLELQRQSKQASARADIAPRDQARTVFPLSFAQERLWFLNQLEPGNPAYNLRSAIRLKGALRIDALETTFQQIVQRHEMLRTTFAIRDGLPVQIVAPRLPLPLSLIDLQAVPAEQQEHALMRLALEEARYAFDLGHGPLLRTTLLRFGPTDHVLLLILHHIVCDGWSVKMLMREVAEFYCASLTSQPPSLPALPVQYGDYAVWQRGWLQGPLLERLLAYWRQQLAGMRVFAVPPDRARSALPTFRGERLFLQIGEPTYTRLTALSQQEGVTLFMVLLLAFQTLLHRYTAEDDVSIGVSIANRTRASLEGLIGFFVNVLVLRSQLGGNPSFRELLGPIRETTLGAYEHQDLPFEELVQALRFDRSAATSLLQVGFDFQRNSRQLLSLPDLALEFVELAGGRPQFDLTLRLVEEEQGLSGTFDYDANLFEAATIAGMVHRFQILLEQIAQNPDQRLLNIPLERPEQPVSQPARAPDSPAADLFAFETDG